MSFRSSRLPCLAVLLSLAGANAEAASLDAVRGEVLVSRGAGFRPVSGPVSLNPGDLVMVGKGGRAVVSYGAGCSEPVAIGAVVVVREQGPCGQVAQATRRAVPDGMMRAGASASDPYGVILPGTDVTPSAADAAATEAVGTAAGAAAAGAGFSSLGAFALGAAAIGGAIYGRVVVVNQGSSP